MRQHGGVASTCIHGFAPGTCLICKTLDSGPATATKEARPAGRKAGRRSASAGVPASAPAAIKPDAVVARRDIRGSGLGLRLVGFLIVALVALAAVWFVVGFVLAVLRILELVAVAVVAGWIGWKLGVRHGRRTRPDK
jgi:Flp pilus assembly protein TadB